MDSKNSQMSPQEAKASLGIATNLMAKTLPQKPSEQSPEPAGQPAQEDPEAKKQEMMTEVTKLVDEKFNELKDLIKNALNEDEQA